MFNAVSFWADAPSEKSPVLDSEFLLAHPTRPRVVWVELSGGQHPILVKFCALNAE